MHILKEVTTGFGLVASVWSVNTVTITRVGQIYHAEGNISLYYSQAALNSGKALLDNCRFKFFDLTLEEINGNTLSAIYARVLTSKPVSMPNPENPEEVIVVETNTYTSNFSGEVCFVGCSIVE